MSSGDSGNIQFHITGFAEAPKIPGMGEGGLAGVLLAEFQKILETFRESLQGDANEGKNLGKLAKDLVTLAAALNAVTDTSESPSTIVTNVESSIDQVKQDMLPFKNSPYYSLLINSLDQIAQLLQGGGIIEAVRQFNDDLQQYIKDWDNKKEKKSDYLTLQADVKTLEQTLKAWPDKILGKPPEALKQLVGIAGIIVMAIGQKKSKEKVIELAKGFKELSDKYGKLVVTPEQMVRLLQAMNAPNQEGEDLRKNFPGVWTTYDGALGAVRQMQAQAATMGNNTVSDIYAKTTAIQQLTKMMSEDLGVPIQAINQSIQRIFR
ncbi:MAG: hypothetical protein AB7F31_00860 [Parachlamydiales bacterium]